ncbi:MAG: glycosyltransferase family 2 protein [Nitrospira sp.]|nr:glycosyltransferase family 2 protein [Nitrospira sp.]
MNSNGRPTTEDLEPPGEEIIPPLRKGENGVCGEHAASSYWVVIPAYNEAATVREVALRARRQCRNVIVVDDASSDGTDRVLADVDVTVLRNETNRGKAGSLVRGFDYALSRGARGVVTLDADGQHAPEEIPLFLEQSWNDPNAFLIGVRRRDQRRESFWRYLANCVADFWIGWAAGRPIEDSQSGFRLYPARLLQTVKIPHGPDRSFVYESEILIEAARQGVALKSVAISVSPRSGPRPSHFQPVSDVIRITKMVARKLLMRWMAPIDVLRMIRWRNNQARLISSSRESRGSQDAGKTTPPGRHALTCSHPWDHR